MVSQEGSPQNTHPEGLTTTQEALADSLFEVGAIKFGAFRLRLHERNPDAPLSPYYVDLRVLPLYPVVMKQAARAYAQVALSAEHYDVVLGISEAGNPLATAFSLETGTPQIYLRKEEKIGHGIPGNFMTPINPGETVLLLDDLVTQADSKLDAIRTLESSGLIVRDVAVLVDREQGGAKQLADAGYRLNAATPFSKLLDYYHRVGKIDEAKYKEAKDYMTANS